MPASIHRRTVSSLTPRYSAASFTRICGMNHIVEPNLRIASTDVRARPTPRRRRRSAGASRSAPRALIRSTSSAHAANASARCGAATAATSARSPTAREPTRCTAATRSPVRVGDGATALEQEPLGIGMRLVVEQGDAAAAVVVAHDALERRRARRSRGESTNVVEVARSSASAVIRATTSVMVLTVVGRSFIVPGRAGHLVDQVGEQAVEHRESVGDAAARSGQVDDDGASRRCRRGRG